MHRRAREVSGPTSASPEASGPTTSASHRAPPRAHGRAAAGVAVGLAIALVLALHPFTGRAKGRGEAVPDAVPGAVHVAVSIDLRHPGARVPREFLGLSFELASLPPIARYASGGDFPAMLRSLGAGVLRFGGASADTRVAWSDAATPLPAWASFALRAGDFRHLRKLASESGWRILLTIGLAHYDPRAAAREVVAAKTALGGWLAGIEIGNEPDSFARHNLRTAPWTPARYNAEVSNYRRAIAGVAPGIALAGPGVSGSAAFKRWGPAEASAQRPALLTGHHYPLGCHKLPAPTIARLLSPRTRRAEDASLRRDLSVSRAGTTGFRLDETNSVSCGGKAGISNTFASALWAADYIARAMQAGVVGINFQGNPTNCHGYTPVCAVSAEQLAKGAIDAQPEWYALLLSKGLIGDRPVRATASRSHANVDVIALLSPRGSLHLVIVDDDPATARHASVELHVGRRFGAATVLALTAPTAAATTGVRLGGAAVAGNGRWHARTSPRSRPDRKGVVTLDLAPSSAMLVTLASARARRG